MACPLMFGNDSTGVYLENGAKKQTIQRLRVCLKIVCFAKKLAKLDKREKKWPKIWKFKPRQGMKGDNLVSIQFINYQLKCM